MSICKSNAIRRGGQMFQLKHAFVFSFFKKDALPVWQICSMDSGSLVFTADDALINNKVI